MSRHKLIIHCALVAEAKPLIKHLSLSRIDTTVPAQLFGSEDGAVLLLVSGVGIINTSIACAWLAGSRDCSRAVWLNIGIAGHGQQAVGSLCWASCVAGPLDEKKYYPYPPPHLEKCINHWLPLQTCLAACNDYSRMDALVDMEAWAMYQLAVRLTTLERIHTVKIVSDNGERDMSIINAKIVEQLYNNHLPALQQMIDMLLLWGGCIERDDSMIRVHQRIMRRCRVTVSQQHQLSDLLRRAQALDIDVLRVERLFDQQRTAIALQELQQLVHGSAFA